MTDLTTEANRLLALAEKATPGPWFSHVGDYVWTTDLKHCITCNGLDGICLTSGDADFIAASHDMADCIRKLLAENEALKISLANAEDALAADAKDSERYRWLRDKARQHTAYDIYGHGGHWSVGFFSDNSALSFTAAIDAAMTEVKK